MKKPGFSPPVIKKFSGKKPGFLKSLALRMSGCLFADHVS
ncbi:Uncharacterized protein dnm_045260 [Desulfonema magnum]|uniref:Uncharacterized protein n=1 Tax=Desulfonema magnum TaxID=45655 RepID=A0A975BP33_9BACT|nr:Uncharacterized protein dnm_045260 [Desulfonema magnum]